MANNFCSNCGEPNTDSNANVCTNCGKPLRSQTESNTNSQNTSYEQTYSNQNTRSSENVVYVKEKNIFVALILSFFFPGAGQVYNGNLKKGLMLLAGAIITLFIFFPLSFIVWAYNLYDAYKDADKMNKGEIPFIEPTANDAIIYAGAFIGIFIAAFIIFAIIGFFIGLALMPFMI